jgi:hypothetical protein
MRNDEALAPIVAVMLILVVVVTLLSLYHTTYLPGLKESAEVRHLHEVEEGILKFGSMIEEAASLKRNISLSQQVPLGGGDIVLNSQKSGGSLQVTQENEPYLTLVIENETGNQTYPLHLVNFSYVTVNNFWVDQGYSWQYGYVNVSRISQGKWVNSVPLQYPTMDSVNTEVIGNSVLACSLIDIRSNGDDVDMYTVSIIPGTHNFTSGNGIARLELKSDVSSTSIPDANATFTVGDTPIKNSYTGLPGVPEQKNITLHQVNITISVY